jgi:hypothetical protein
MSTEPPRTSRGDFLAKAIIAKKTAAFQAPFACSVFSFTRRKNQHVWAKIIILHQKINKII